MEPRAAAAAAQPHRRARHDVSARRCPAQRREPRPADAGRVPRAQRAHLARRRSRCGTGACRTRTASSRRAAGGWHRHSQDAACARGDTVAVMAPNVPALLEAHYAVPALGGDSQCAQRSARRARRSRSASMHGGAKVLITDAEFAPSIKAALAQMQIAAAGRRHRRQRRPARRAARQRALRRPACGRRPAVRLARPARTNGIRSRCCTRRARPAIPKASCITTAARISTRSATRLRSSSRRTACTCGRCRCSIAADGRTRGRSRPRAARTCACAASILRDLRRRSATSGVTHLCGAPIVLNLLDPRA